MNPWFAKAIFVLASVVMIAIRVPHGKRSLAIPIERSFKGALETVLLTIAWLAFLVPLIWIATSVFAFADFALRPIPLVVGTLCIALGLWLFHLSHADLGINWSITLDVRENHRLVTQGIYRRIRHPMYLALLIYAMGLAFVIPNYVVGPSYLIAMALLVALRVGPEERMMRETFGVEYEDYVACTARLVPGLW